jgi:hypothetical protein
MPGVGVAEGAEVDADILSYDKGSRDSAKTNVR